MPPRRKPIGGKTGKTVLRYLLVLILLDAVCADLWPNPKRSWTNVILSSPTPQIKPSAPVDFKIQLNNGKSVMKQFVRIDSANKIESFHVLPYDSVDESVVLHDFNKNWTLILFPKKNQCFIQRLDPGTPPPQQLKTSIQRVIATNGTNSTVRVEIEETSTWKVTNMLFSRQILTNRMLQMCANAPIYEINRIKAKLFILGPPRTGRSSNYLPRSACGGRVCIWTVRWRFSCSSSAPYTCAWKQLREKVCQDIQC